MNENENKVYTTRTTASGFVIPSVVVGCERCQTDDYVPHDSCMYAGKVMGHSEAHCTANACY